MGIQKDELTLEQRLANYRELAREFPEGHLTEVLRDLIADLERQRRSSGK
jgi:hypothetical protein